MVSFTQFLHDQAALGALAAYARPVTTERRLAEAARSLVAGMAAQGGTEPGTLPLGLAEAASVLWARVLRYDAADPLWPDRDRFVLSAAAAAPLLRALLHLTGHAGLTAEALCDPSGHAYPAVELAPGPSGQGLAAAVGMALAERMLAARFGKSLVDHRTWVLADEDELSEGVSHEAVSLAGSLRLEKLAVIVGVTEAPAEDRPRRLAACGWAVKAVDGHDPAALLSALSAALRSRKPTLIACRLAGGARGAWTGGGLDVAADLSRLWRAAGSRGSKGRRAWLKRLARHPQRAEFERVQAGRLPDAWQEPVAALRTRLAEDDAAPSGREVLDALLAALPELAAGTAEPRGAKTAPAEMGPSCYAARVVPYGAREHGMAAAMHGVALHGGLIPCGTARLEASDYLRPALRLSAQLGRRVVGVLTYGAPGPDEAGLPGAHQPMGHLAAWRATPNLHVLRPADPVEAAECCDLAIRRADGPSVMVLPERPGPTLRTDATENRCARGGYVVADADGPRRATLIASGGELGLAMAARALLAADGIAVAVVSLPCWELFAAQDEAWRAGVLGAAPRFGIEAAAGFGWERWLGPDGVFIGSPGVSPGHAAGPAETAQPGLSPDGIAAAVRRRIDTPSPQPPSS